MSVVAKEDAAVVTGVMVGGVDGIVGVGEGVGEIVDIDGGAADVELDDVVIEVDGVAAVEVDSVEALEVALPPTRPHCRAALLSR